MSYGMCMRIDYTKEQSEIVGKRMKSYLMYTWTYPLYLTSDFEILNVSHFIL